MRYSDCINPDGRCVNCSCTNYGRDCHNAPANTVAYFRIAAGLTQQALADKAGFNRVWIAKIERGETDITKITLANALALSSALGVAPRDLI